MEQIEIKVKSPNNWLYKDYSEEERVFVKGITTLKNDVKNWKECTQSEKEIWESEHKPEETEENDEDITSRNRLN